jgi:hypothetical protein
MHTYSRALMFASAVFMALLGLPATFMPQETVAYAGQAATPATVVLVQVAGALYLGFAILNWAARGVLIGGIYARPVAMGNFLHFAAVAVTLLKAITPQAPAPALAVTAAYVVFAAWFGLVTFTHPATRKTRAE